MNDISAMKIPKPRNPVSTRKETRPKTQKWVPTGFQVTAYHTRTTQTIGLHSK
jgi:hypothetical protein